MIDLTELFDIFTGVNDPTDVSDLHSGHTTTAAEPDNDADRPGRTVASDGPN